MDYFHQPTRFNSGGVFASTGFDSDEETGEANADTLTVAAGQSNIGNWSSGTFNSSGEVAFLSTMDSLNPGGSNAFVNCGVGTSFVSKTGYDAAGGTPTTVNGVSTPRYWVDDSVPASLTAGPLALAMLDTIALAGKSYSRVTHVAWDQGEQDETPLRDGTLTQAQYQADLVWLFAYMATNFPSLEKITIVPIGKRTVENLGTIKVRAVQQAMPGLNSSVQLAAEKYDQGMYDSLHIDEAGYTAMGTRVAWAICRQRGVYSGVAFGPRVTSTSISGDQIIVSITHDVATTLETYAGTEYTSTPIDVTPTTTGFFYLLDSNGGQTGIDKVEITGAAQITITAASLITGDLILNSGYSAFVGLENGSIIRDGSALPLRSGLTDVDYTAGSPATGDWLTQEVLSTFAPADTSKAATITATSTSLTSLFQLGSRVASADDAGAMRDMFSYPTLSSTTSLTRTRATTSAAAANDIFNTAVVQWPSSMVDSIQLGTINLTTTTGSGTATITSVDTSRSVVYLTGLSSSATGSNTIPHTLDLTNATTVTATADANITTATRNIGFCVIQFKTGITVSKQDVTIAIGTGESSHDATITAVRRSRAMTFFRGWRKTAGTATASETMFPYVTLASTTKLTAARYNTSATDFLEVKATVVEFAASKVSVQRGLNTIANSTSSKTSSVMPVTVANSFINRTGFLQSSGAVSTESSIFATLTLTDASTITANRGGTNGLLTQSFELVSFL